jgi:predicted dehydrogenase
MKKLRIGILSTAGIGKKNWKAIHHSGNCAITAVASRDLLKSRAFIDECQGAFGFSETPLAFGSYEELVASPIVDAVYIPLPTGLRHEWVLRAAAAGKHIICEKPCAKSAAELGEMLAACAKNSVQFMDGVMFMHSSRLDSIREVLTDGKSVGPIRRISSAFSFYPYDQSFFKNNIRTSTSLEPSGCLGDLGWYSIRITLWALGWKLPTTVSGHVLSLSNAADASKTPPLEFSGELFFEGETSASFFCSFLTEKQQWAHISGQKGWLRLPDFVHPLNSYEPGFEVNEKFSRVAGQTPCPPDVDPQPQGHATAQDTRMFRNFANQVFTGKLNEAWPNWAMQTQVVVDACLESARRGSPVRLTHSK